MLLITVGNVRAATTPIMPRVIRTSARVKATRLAAWLPSCLAAKSVPRTTSRAP